MPAILICFAPSFYSTELVQPHREALFGLVCGVWVVLGLDNIFGGGTMMGVALSRPSELGRGTRPWLGAKMREQLQPQLQLQLQVSPLRASRSGRNDRVVGTKEQKSGLGGEALAGEDGDGGAFGEEDVGGGGGGEVGEGGAVDGGEVDADVMAEDGVGRPAGMEDAVLGGGGLARGRPRIPV